MIYLYLFFEFFKVGAFTFGGAYGAIPLIRQAVVSNGWMTDEVFSNMIAISESTPGPIMVNAATYVGNMQGGFLGAAVATLGVVLPSFIIILLIATFIKHIMEKSGVKAGLMGMKLCIAAVITSTGLFMLVELLGFTNLETSFSFNINALIIGLILAACIFIYKKVKGKKLSPIILICISFVLGIIFYR